MLVLVVHRFELKKSVIANEVKQSILMLCNPITMGCHVAVLLAKTGFESVYNRTKYARFVTHPSPLKLTTNKTGVLVLVLNSPIVSLRFFVSLWFKKTGKKPIKITLRFYRFVLLC